MGERTRGQKIPATVRLLRQRHGSQEPRERVESIRGGFCYYGGWGGHRTYCTCIRCQRLGTFEKRELTLCSAREHGWDLQTRSERFCRNGGETEFRRRQNAAWRRHCNTQIFTRPRDALLEGECHSPIPALLAMRHAASELRDIVVVRVRHENKRRIASKCEEHQLVAGTYQRGEIWRLARRRTGLVHFPSAFLGERYSDLGM